MLSSVIQYFTWYTYNNKILTVLEGGVMPHTYTPSL